MSDNNNLVRLGGLWLNKTASGKQYMAGNLGPGAKLLVFRNERKTNAGQPDYILYVTAKQPDNAQASTQQAQPELDEDIPF